MIPTTLEPAIYLGNAADLAGKLPAQSVRCAVTSSPYWGLRSYGTPPQIWGGRYDHDHHWIVTKPRRNRKEDDAGGDLSKNNAGASYEAQGGHACECGAWKGELGQEPTPQLFVQHLVMSARPIRRILTDDGTFWFNLADTYSTHPAGLKGERRWQASLFKDSDHTGEEQAGDVDKRTSGLREKNLCLVPERFAIAMQDDGWFVRSRVVWAKPNGMREAVKDRPMRATEYIFQLTKTANSYYAEERMRQPFSEATIREIGVYYRGKATKLYEKAGVQNPSDTKRRIIERLADRGGAMLPDFWWFSPAAYEGAHFATFPEILPEICITASSDPGDVVLDPFMGSGTTMAVAKRLGRRSVGFDLNEEYIALARDRCAKVVAPEGIKLPTERGLGAIA